MILRLRRKIADRHCWKSSQQSLSWEGWLLNQESKHFSHSQSRSGICILFDPESNLREYTPSLPIGVE